MLRCSIAFLFLSACASHAVELHQIEVRTGTEGLSPVSLSVTNAGGEAVSCSADIAHWYSLDVATVAPRTSMPVELWFDSETGTFSILNDKRENLPVERLWCGLDGRAYATRAQIVLERAALPADRAVTCVAKDDRLSCG